YDVRSYASGGHRVDVTVENCLDTPVADEVVYDVAVAIDRQTVFLQTNVKHGYLARWRRVFTIAGLRESTVAADLSPFVAAHALPRFLSSVVSPSRSLSGKGVSGSGFGILAFGDLTLPMDAHGGRPELAPYP